MASTSPPLDHRVSVDTTSPFRSVKEAISTYGEQFLAQRFASNNHERIAIKDLEKLPNHEEVAAERSHFLNPPRTEYVEDHGYGNDGGEIHGNGDHPTDDPEDIRAIANKLKKLVAELEETRHEFKLLAKKQSDTEVTLASLNAELHKNMSKIARLEANEAATNVKQVSRLSPFERGQDVKGRFSAEQNDINMRRRMDDQTTIEHVLNFGICEGYFERSKRVVKKKPIVPLVTDIFACNKSPLCDDKKDDLAFLHPMYARSLHST